MVQEEFSMIMLTLRSLHFIVCGWGLRVGMRRLCNITLEDMPFEMRFLLSMTNP